MPAQLTIMGAGGKMGQRITRLVLDDPGYEVDYVEPSEAGIEQLNELGVEVIPPEAALPESDAVVMAVPDELIGDITAQVVTEVDPGTLILLLDPAAAAAGVLPSVDHVGYFVTHPCHPSFFTADTGIGAEDTDWFGGQGHDAQDIVCALEQGTEADYELGETIATDIFAPVRTTHRLTVEQMAYLEPALVESLMSSCMDAINEGLDRVVAEGVPREAAEEFLFGHMRISIGLIFGFTDFPYSDGAKQAIEEAKGDLFRDGWLDRIFDQENLQRSVENIASPD